MYNGNKNIYFSGFFSKAFQDYLRTTSCLPPWNHYAGQGGYWRSLLVKSNRNNDLMVVGIMNPRNTNTVCR